MKPVPKPVIRLKRRNKPIKRRGKPRFKAGRDPVFLDWIRQQPCLIWATIGAVRCTYYTPAEAAHVKSRGAGGADRGNTVPLCRKHHLEQHYFGVRSFEETYEISLKAAAQAFTVQYDAQQILTPSAG